MNRKDFRPSNSSNSISDRDRKIIDRHKESSMKTERQNIIYTSNEKANVDGKKYNMEVIEHKNSNGKTTYTLNELNPYIPRDYSKEYAGEGQDKVFKKKKFSYGKTEQGEKILAQGQNDDLINDDGKHRTWRSRSDNSISHETLRNGRWELD